MTFPSGREQRVDPDRDYNPENDPDLDAEQKAEQRNRISSWVAFFADADDLETIERAIPDPADRWLLIKAFGFASRKLTNGVLTLDEAVRVLGDEGAVDRFLQAGCLVEHPRGLRIVDFLKLNQTCGRRGVTSRARATAGRKGGEESGKVRRALREARDARQLLQASNGDALDAELPERSTVTVTGTGTETGTGTHADVDAVPASPSEPGSPAGTRPEPSSERPWLHVEPKDMGDFGGLRRIYSKAIPLGLVEAGDLGMFDLAAHVCRAVKKGRNPAAYLAQSLQSWKENAAGFELVAHDYDTALDWYARQDKALAHRIARLMRDRDFADWPESCHDGVRADYERRIELIDCAND